MINLYNLLYKPWIYLSEKISRKFSIDLLTAKQFIKYVLIGGTVAVIEMTVFILFTWSNKFSMEICFSISFIIATLFHFLLNKYWNFKSFERPVYFQLRTYAITVGISYTYNFIIMQVLVNFLGMPSILAKLLATASLVLWSFAMQKYITFQKGIRFFLKKLFLKISSPNGASKSGKGERKHGPKDNEE